MFGVIVQVSVVALRKQRDAVYSCLDKLVGKSVCIKIFSNIRNVGTGMEIQVNLTERELG